MSRMADHLITIGTHYEPEHVFDEGKLAAWAEEHGFVREPVDLIDAALDMGWTLEIAGVRIA